MKMFYLLDMIKFDDKLCYILRLVYFYKCWFNVIYGKDILCVYEIILDVF